MSNQVSNTLIKSIFGPKTVPQALRTNFVLLVIKLVIIIIIIINEKINLYLYLYLLLQPLC